MEQMLDNKANLASSSSLSSEAPKASISVLIDTINSNKIFSKLIIYSLNTLKSYLIVQNHSQAVDNSLSILQSNIPK